MPLYKKRKAAPKKKRAKRSYAMVPRPLLNGEMVHRHIVTMSTSQTAQLGIDSQVGGVSRFYANPAVAPPSPNLSLNVSLANVTISLGGLPTIVVPNPSVAELQQLYDTFQIEKVEITIFSGNTDSIVTGEASSGYNWVLPLLGHAPDTDDDANTSITQLQQYSNYKCDQLGQKPLKITVVPCSAGTTFGPGYVRLQKQDVNVSQAATPHYGYKMAVDGFRSTANGNNCLLSMQFRIFYLMKSTR